MAGPAESGLRTYNCEFFANVPTMPIYAYLCESCGHRQDVLQKISDPVLGTCPACGAPSFVKQVTAAGFQLKGSGWYVTDFRGGGNGNKSTADATTETAGAASDAPAAPPAADSAATPASSEKSSPLASDAT